MRVALVVGGIVANVVEVPDLVVAAKLYPDAILVAIDPVFTEGGAEIGAVFTGDKFEPPPAPVENLEQEFADAEVVVQAHLDLVAQSWGYDNIFTATTYADEPADPVFQKEGQVLRAWRSQTWAYCIQVQDAIKAGKQAVPNLDEFLITLPVVVRPT